MEKENRQKVRQNGEREWIESEIDGEREQIESEREIVTQANLRL